MVLNTATVSLAVTPTICSTLFSHYFNRKPLRHRPTAHLSYDEGLHLVRQFLIYASHHTVEELQAFMSQWVPHPQWIRVEPTIVPDSQLAHAASVLEAQLGPDGLRRVGGRQWWQWRKPKSPLRAEWVEMRADFNARKRAGDAPCRRIMLYVHGGAYFMGSIDEHRYQLQRHARKLKARVLAPRYRLAPQFPFPCGLQDCLATYLHLLTLQDPSTIVLAGDSAGGGMVLSILVILRDRGIPLPAGAILISPWVDLTHSFPSLDLPCPLDYIPPYGFHQRPSVSWPPPTEEVLEEMHRLDRMAHSRRATSSTSEAATHTADASADTDDSYTTAVETDTEAEATKAMFAANRATLTAGDEEVYVREQIQLYTTNNMLTHPLVSPVMQPTLGGLPPLMVVTGGGEILRDEQMYVAHKCANPAKYAPAAARLSDADRAAIEKYPPTDVQLQVWDDLCHVAPTLSFTRPAKFMYRAIAQFGAWALSRAQDADIEIENDDTISVISSGSSNDDAAGSVTGSTSENGNLDGATNGQQASGRAGGSAASAPAQGKKPAAGNSQPKVGRAGDKLPPFQDHMIRQRVTRHGEIFPLAPASRLPGCTMAPESVGVYKQGPVARWTKARLQWDSRYSKDRDRVFKQRLKDAAVGFVSFGPGEHPPPGALAGRRKIGADLTEKAPKRSRGLAMWSKWSSRHDEHTMEREQQAGRAPSSSVVSASEDEEQGRRPTTDTARREAQRRTPAGASGDASGDAAEDTNGDAHDDAGAGAGAGAGADAAENTTSADGTAVSDRAGQEGENNLATANGSSRPHSGDNKTKEGGGFSDGRLLGPNGALAKEGVSGKRPFLSGIALPFSLRKEADTASMVTLNSGELRPTTSTGAVPPE